MSCCIDLKIRGRRFNISVEESERSSWAERVSVYDVGSRRHCHRQRYDPDGQRRYRYMTRRDEPGAELRASFLKLRRPLERADSPRAFYLLIDH